MPATREKIYFYSTLAQYEDQLRLGRTPMLKIGQTIEQEASERIDQQDTTSIPQPLMCRGVYEVEGTDNEFRNDWLIPRGYKVTRIDKKREWIYITSEDAELELRAWQKSKKVKVEKVAETRTLRKHQEDFIFKIMSNWERWKEFLLFAKCRAGKSTMVLSAIAASGAKVSLVMSYRNSPKQSWEDDTKTFKNSKTLSSLTFVTKISMKFPLILRNI